ncbi:MAG: glycosyltransferase family 2 protein [Planctomycetes bacterium]|nr:glycosyltransferase family 2 protein [Planctomycetota bacterium]
MIPITATVITFNEETNIRACLESVSWVDHIVVIDSGSSDRTTEIAREFTANVIVTDWPGHVAQKNRAIDHSPTDWIFSLDADERCTPELRREIERVARDGEPSRRGYSVRRKTRYLGRWILHGGWYPDRKVRFFDRRAARWGGVDPHDHIDIDEPVEALDADLLHFTYRDVRHHLNVIDFFTDIAARQKDLRGKAHPILGMLVRPPVKFARMYWWKRGYRDGFAGFVIAVLGAYYVFLKDAKLWERRRLRARGLDPDAADRFARGPEWRAPRANLGVDGALEAADESRTP